MDTTTRPSRLLATKKYFFWLGVFFTLIFFWLTYYYRDQIPPGTSSAHGYFAKYGIYVPLAVGLISILKSYVLLFIFHIIRINHTITKILIYLMIYGFWLTLAIQLAYFEPRYTDVAIVLIDAYAFPLLVASGSTIGLVLLLSLFRTSSPPVEKKEKPIPVLDV
jgi:hypothetical protein